MFKLADSGTASAPGTIDVVVYSGEATIANSYLNSRLLCVKTDLLATDTVFAGDAGVQVILTDCSYAMFRRCTFRGQRKAVVAECNCVCVFVSCVFEDNDISVYAYNNSLARFIGCTFTRGRMAEIVAVKSPIQLSVCSFWGQAENCIAASFASAVSITKCSASSIRGIFCVSSNRSKVAMVGCTVVGVRGDVMLAMRESSIVLKDSTFKRISDDALALSEAQGWVVSCFFDLIGGTTIQAMDDTSVTFMMCTFGYAGEHHIVAKSLSFPRFLMCSFAIPRQSPVVSEMLSLPQFVECMFDHPSKYIATVSNRGMIGKGFLFVEDKDGTCIRVDTDEIMPRDSHSVFVSPDRLTGFVMRCNIAPSKVPEMVYLPCLHAVAPEHMGDDNLVCDECGSLNVKKAKVYHEDECIICHERNSCVMLVPCCHLQLCYPCFRRISKDNPRCPMCKRAFTSSCII